MSEKEFIIELEKIGVVLSERQLKFFRIYAEFLLEYNAHTNLTAIRNLEDVYLKHFYDSLLILKYKKLTVEKVLDIGSGAGFPGVPLKIANPDIDLTILDSNGKKTKFLEELKNRLEIDYEVINDRAEMYVKKVRETFDLVTARAVTAMPVLSELAIPFVRVGGYFIPYKGDIDERIENGEYAIHTLGGEIKAIDKTNLPLENSARTFIVIEKKNSTDEKYPRLFDKINKKPLQKL